MPAEREEIDLRSLHVEFQGAHSLYAVYVQKNALVAAEVTEFSDVYPLAGRELHLADRNRAGPRIAYIGQHIGGDQSLVGLDHPQFYAPPPQSHPWIDVRRELDRRQDDIVALFPPDAAGRDLHPVGRILDEGYLVGSSADQFRRCCSHLRYPPEDIILGRGPASKHGGQAVQDLARSEGQRAYRSVIEIYRITGDGELVPDLFPDPGLVVQYHSVLPPEIYYRYLKE